MAINRWSQSMYKDTPASTCDPAGGSTASGLLIAATTLQRSFVIQTSRSAMWVAELLGAPLISLLFFEVFFLPSSHQGVPWKKPGGVGRGGPIFSRVGKLPSATTILSQGHQEINDSCRFYLLHA